MPIAPHRIFPYTATSERPFVLWTGAITDPDWEAFRVQRLSVVPLDSEATFTTFVHRARAIIADVSAGGMDWIRTDRAFVKTLYHHGVLLVIRARNDAERKAATLATGGLSSRRLRSGVFDWNERMSISEVAVQIALWTPGPEAGSVDNRPEIRYYPNTPDDMRVESPECVTLLRRAFSDCSNIILRALGEGYSGQVYRADATFADQPMRPRTLPFVAKLDRRHKVEREFTNYWSFAHPYVPFHQRALVDSTRSCLGFDFGLLVGTFVSGSESLIKTALRGHAHAAFHSLYESALTGWCACSSVARGNPVVELKRKYPLNSSFVASGRFADMQAAGVIQSPDALIDTLSALDPIDYRVGTVHGDLHGRNVQTRANDAILLDFYNTGVSQPLAFDPAYLEVTTAFSADAHNEIGTEWVATLENLYRLEALTFPPRPDVEHRTSTWLRNIIRQIRLFAMANVESNREFPLVLAYVLLRHATFTPRNDVHSAERVKAYLLAEQLVGQLAA